MQSVERFGRKSAVRSIAIFSVKIFEPFSRWAIAKMSKSSKKSGDVEKFKIPKEVTIKLNQLDIKRLDELKSYEWFKHKKWQAEFDLMKEKNIKMELEALSKKGIRFITEEYLPQKIKSGDFLP
jgi:DNA topoisomerase-6 subunit A